MPQKKTFLSKKLWDLFCIASIGGIWPRYIEPNLLSVSKLDIALPNLSKQLVGLKILHFSDIHIHDKMPDNFLDRVVKHVNLLSPDLILFTGDFLCYSKIPEARRLQTFLKRLKAPFGSFASLGNHDYQEYISLSDDGSFTPLPSVKGHFIRSLYRIRNSAKPQLSFPTEPLSEPHDELLDLLKTTPFKLLHNTTETICIQGVKLNITGLGDLWAGQCRPDSAFQNYDSKHPGIILSHNPDTIDLLKSFPGELILAGHNHGGQINIPWLWSRLSSLKHKELKCGLFDINGKKIFVSRGIGAAVPFRLLAMPEITLLTLKAER